MGSGWLLSGLWPMTKAHAAANLVNARHAVSIIITMWVCRLFPGGSSSVCLGSIIRTGRPTLRPDPRASGRKLQQA